MYWRSSNKDFQAAKGRANKTRLRELSKSAQPLGIVAYLEDRPVGWCSISPRESLVRLKTSRHFQPVDDAEVWSITCLYVRPGRRRKGLSVELIRAACAYAENLGARIIESYPLVASGRAVPDVFAWVGFASTFERVGFREVARPSGSRSFMRYHAAPRESLDRNAKNC